MLLAIDVGNTNTVLGLYELGGETAKLISDWRITTPTNQTASEFGIVLANLFALSKLEMSVVDGIAISSVVPPFDPILRQVCEPLRPFKARDERRRRHRHLLRRPALRPHPQAGL